MEFAPGEAIQFPLPFFRSYARPISVAWNPLQAEVRPVGKQTIKVLSLPPEALSSVLNQNNAGICCL